MKKLKVVDQSSRSVSRPGTLFDPTFVYMKGADVQRTWRRYGWKAPSEYRNDYEFKKNREGTQ
jgi:hypothetical protein